jgi:hypothetical protein
MSQVSLLIGAGFSIPLGYPSAANLTDKFLALSPDKFSIQSDGTIYMLPQGQVDNPGNFPNLLHKIFFCDIASYYNKRFDNFNYEEFFDFLYKNRNDGDRDAEFNDFINTFISDHKNWTFITDAANFISTALRSLDQFVVHFIKDKHGDQYYEPVHLGEGTVPEHHNILKCLRKLGENNTVHIHSLNHDMVFERYKSSDYLKGDLSDGFEELGSPYFYSMEGGMLGGRMLRISKFTNRYEKVFNLYKLHSSIDYYPFYHADVIGSYSKETMVKTGMWIRSYNLFKESNKNGNLEYFNSWVEYKPDFLTGTDSKILRYKDPVYFEKQFKNFEKNLSVSEMLFVVGYGCNDKEVNNIVFSKFPIGKKRVYVAAKNLTPAIDEFIKKTNAIHILKYVQNIEPLDIGLK